MRTPPQSAGRDTPHSLIFLPWLRPWVIPCSPVCPWSWSSSFQFSRLFCHCRHCTWHLSGIVRSKAVICLQNSYNLPPFSWSFAGWTLVNHPLGFPSSLGNLWEQLAEIFMNAMIFLSPIKRWQCTKELTKTLAPTSGLLLILFSWKGALVPLRRLSVHVFMFTMVSNAGDYSGHGNNKLMYRMA